MWDSTDSTLARYGHYRKWHDDGGPKPGTYYRRIVGEVLVDEVTDPPR